MSQLYKALLSLVLWYISGPAKKPQEGICNKKNLSQLKSAEPAGENDCPGQWLLLYDDSAKQAGLLAAALLVKYLECNAKRDVDVECITCMFLVLY